MSRLAAAMAGARGGLTRRTLLASGLLAVIVGGAFAVLRAAIEEERSAGELAIHSRDELSSIDTLEKLVIDIETGLRGFVITRKERFLEPWRIARAEFPPRVVALMNLADDSGQRRRAQVIERRGVEYIERYTVPLVEASRHGKASARSVAATAEGKRRVDSLRALFAEYRRQERAILSERERAARAATDNALAVATAGVVASVLIILLFGAYLGRTIVLPIRRASAMANRVAGGDLGARVPERGPAEIGALERALNTMGTSLEASQAELHLLADEQGALRRVATLVARDVAPAEVWDAAASEVGRLMGADGAALLRLEADGSVTAVAVRGEVPLPPGERVALPDDSASAKALASGRPANAESQGVITAAVPITVEGRLWGAIAARWGRQSPPPADAEPRLAQFSELVATAIANAAGRDELLASRARVVATADETRRRIQRDLHDGAQQRLVHAVITLKLAKRELEPSPGPAADLVDEALSHAETATSSLRELVRGILPATLTRGGLQAAVRALAAEAPLPVEVDVTSQRLPPALEATAYFIVAEALTNVAKHSGASRAEVTARVDGDELELEVRDDGAGGAELDESHGLLGLKDRAAALGGELRVDSPPGRGTSIYVRLPIPT